MTCPKCKTEDEQGNFCSNCAAPLREKCPECEGIELIGRKICETKLSKAMEEMEAYVYKRRLKLEIHLPLLIAIATTIPIALTALFFSDNANQFLWIKETKYYWLYNSSSPIKFGFSMIGLMVFISMTVGYKILNSVYKRNGKIRQDFLNSNQEAAEIIREAEGKEE